MLDLKFIRDNPNKVKTALKNRGLSLEIEPLLKLDKERRELLLEYESLSGQQNKASDEIARLKREKMGAAPILEAMKTVSQKTDEINEKVSEIDENISKVLINIPNMPHSSVPTGKPPEANKQVKSWGELKKLNFKPRSHIELGEKLDILDFPRSAKISGAGFCLFKGAGARLERALYNFMLDLHTQEHGYTEIFPPFLVNRASMTGTGQLPKLEEDMYRLKDDDLFLIPTAEVPVTNIFRDEILPEETLPIYYTAYTACFRREAGSYGKETKGLTRVHQFDKVELVKFCVPAVSYDEHEKLLSNAETILQKLWLPYRVILLCTGDLSFAAAKCYDIECYAPGTDKWLEVSSCSNFEDFQARRANIKYRPKGGGKPQYLHTLNGSGVALARTVIAILENYQQPDGSVVIPEVLRPYMGGNEKIARG